MRRAAGIAAVAVALTAPALAGPGQATAAAQPGNASYTVQTKPGATATAARALGAGGLRIHRRQGTRLQVVADARRARSLARLPGVAGVRPANAPFGDRASALALTQGLARTGADVAGKRARGGAGLVIAILDLGFGTNIPALQAAGELPPDRRLQTVSFDPAAGLAGANAYGHRTNHGELVAQTVYDYAPNAIYVFVNYHSEADFVAATNWLIERRPDIVVHSNNFLEGPFDGTGPLAQAVDRVAAAGALWFNSAGNYARQHWRGQWSDADGDGELDWATPGWTFERRAGNPITFALSWHHDDLATPTDFDLVLERRDADGAWAPVAASRDRQTAGARPAERIVGYASPVDGTFRLRVVHRAGPVPSRPLSIFTREVPLADAGGTSDSSIPTPADAVGAIAVGAVDWRGDTLKSYSSHGPSGDGRLKPDIVAPTGTRVMGRDGFRGVGGTSNAAPNAAGAAAILMASARRSGEGSDAATIRARLMDMAVDLGQPGADNMFGGGRVRISLNRPKVGRVTPAPGAPVRGTIRARFDVETESTLTRWGLSLDGVPVAGRSSTRPGGARINTRRLADGVHILRAEARNYPGNTAARAWAIRVDNTRPEIPRADVVVAEAPRRATRPAARVVTRPGAQRAVRLRVRASDAGASGPLALRVAITGPDRSVTTRTLRSGRTRVIALGQLHRGRYTARIRVADPAGNARSVTRRFVVR